MCLMYTSMSNKILFQIPMTMIFYIFVQFYIKYTLELKKKLALLLFCFHLGEK